MSQLPEVSSRHRAVLWSAVVAVLLGGPADPARSQVSALWIAETGGALKIAVADGALLLEIADLGAVRAVAVDPARETVWLYHPRTLASYGFDGSPLWSAAVQASGTPHALLAANPADGSVWLAVGRDLWSYGPGGQELSHGALARAADALALDPEGGLLWIAAGGGVTARDAVSGDAVLDLDLPAAARDLDVEPRTGVLWVATDDALRRYGADGEPLGALALDGAHRVAADGAGGAWAARGNELVHLDAAGTPTAAFVPWRGGAAIDELVADPTDRSAWAARHAALVHAGEDGGVLHLLDLGNARVLGLALDVCGGFAPAVGFVAPAEDALLATATPELDLALSGCDLDPSTLSLSAGGVSFTAGCSFAPGGAFCTPNTPLPEGEVVLSANVANRRGDVSPAAERRITVDTVAPELEAAAVQVAAAATAGRFAVVGGPGATEAGAAVRAANPRTGEAVASTAAADGGFLLELAAAAGDVLELRAADAAGNAAPPLALPVPESPPRLIGPEGGTVASADGAVTLTVPAGALAAPTVLSIEATGELGPGGLAPVYDLRPDGTVFAVPALLEMSYGDLELGAVAPQTLRLTRGREDGRWSLVPGGGVDLEAQVVSGELHHLSPYSQGETVDLFEYIFPDPEVLAAEGTNPDQPQDALEPMCDRPSPRRGDHQTIPVTSDDGRAHFYFMKSGAATADGRGRGYEEWAVDHDFFYIYTDTTWSRRYGEVGGPIPPGHEAHPPDCDVLCNDDTTCCRRWRCNEVPPEQWQSFPDTVCCSDADFAFSRYYPTCDGGTPAGPLGAQRYPRRVLRSDHSETYGTNVKGAFGSDLADQPTPMTCDEVGCDAAPDACGTGVSTATIAFFIHPGWTPDNHNFGEVVEARITGGVGCCESYYYARGLGWVAYRPAQESPIDIFGTDTGEGTVLPADPCRAVEVLQPGDDELCQYYQGDGGGGGGTTAEATCVDDQGIPYVLELADGTTETCGQGCLGRGAQTHADVTHADACAVCPAGAGTTEPGAAYPGAEHRPPEWLALTMPFLPEPELDEPAPAPHRARVADAYGPSADAPLHLGSDYYAVDQVLEDPGLYGDCSELFDFGADCHPPGAELSPCNGQGQPVVPAAPGAVAWVERDHAVYGNLVLMSHGCSDLPGCTAASTGRDRSFYTLYAHLDGIPGELVAGTAVPVDRYRTFRLGTLGNTGGGSCGAHLHFVLKEAEGTDAAAHVGTATGVSVVPEPLGGAVCLPAAQMDGNPLVAGELPACSGGSGLTAPLAGAVPLPAGLELRWPFGGGDGPVIVTAGYTPHRGAPGHLGAAQLGVDERHALDLTLSDPQQSDGGLGRAVVAAAGGTVERAGWGARADGVDVERWGQTVVVRHEPGDGHVYFSIYAHLDEILVARDDAVAQGDVLGTLGRSAYGERVDAAVEPHLHWSLVRGAEVVDAETGFALRGGVAVVPEPLDGGECLGPGAGPQASTNPGWPDDVHEPNDTAATAADLGVLRNQGITEDSLYVRNYSAESGDDRGDLDWYLFDAPDIDPFSVEASLIASSAGDLDLRLYRLEAGGGLAPVASATGAGSNESVFHTPASPGTFAVRINQEVAESDAWYRLSILQADPPSEPVLIDFEEMGFREDPSPYYNYLGVSFVNARSLHPIDRDQYFASLPAYSGVINLQTWDYITDPTPPMEIFFDSPVRSVSARVTAWDNTTMRAYAGGALVGTLQTGGDNRLGNTNGLETNMLLEISGSNIDHVTFECDFGCIYNLTIDDLTFSY